MAERFTAEQVLELLNNEFDVSGGEDNEFEEDGIYSYLPGASGESVSILELRQARGRTGY